MMNNDSVIPSLAIALLLVAGHRTAATFTVNSTDDGSDGSCDAVHCSLREAITAANAAPNDPSGLDTIVCRLAVPGSHDQHLFSKEGA